MILVVPSVVSLWYSNGLTWSYLAVVSFVTGRADAGVAVGTIDARGAIATRNTTAIVHVCSNEQYIQWQLCLQTIKDPIKEATVVLMLGATGSFPCEGKVAALLLEGAFNRWSAVEYCIAERKLTDFTVDSIEAPRAFAIVEVTASDQVAGGGVLAGEAVAGIGCAGTESVT